MTNLPHSQEGISPEEMKGLMDEMSASKVPTSQSLEEMFGEPISVYTDAEAVEDGFIVDLAKFTNVRFLGLPINRMTRHLYDDLEPFAKSAADTLYDGNLGSAFGCPFATKTRFAQGDPRNSGEIGDIYTIPPKLWLVRNEVGGWTAMYPEDLLTGRTEGGAIHPLFWWSGIRIKSHCANDLPLPCRPAFYILV